MFNKKFQNPVEEGKCTQEKIKIQNIKLGSKLIVQEGQEAVIVVKGKPYDTFKAGEYELEGAIIPKTYKACNLAKPKKSKGSKKQYYPKSFKGSIIFINSQDVHNMRYSTLNILLFDRIDEFRFKLVGNYDFHIEDKEAFSKFVAKTGRGDEYIKSKLNHFVSKKIRYEFHKENFMIEQFIMKDSSVFDNIIHKLNKRLQKVGIKLYNPQIIDFKLTKKSQEKINHYIGDGVIKIHFQRLVQKESIDVDTQECNKDI